LCNKTHDDDDDDDDDDETVARLTAHGVKAVASYGGEWQC